MSYQTSDAYGSGHPGSFSFNSENGYYLEPKVAFDDWTGKIQDENITVIRNNEMGESLALSYKDPKDPLTNAIASRKNPDISDISTEIQPGGIKYPISNNLSTGKVSINPYFHSLPNLSTSQIQPGNYFPACLPRDYEVDEPLPDPTFEFPPTCAIYYGESETTVWKYNTSAEKLPMMYQQPPVGTSEFVQFQDAMTYADTGDFINEIIGENRGLVRNFWLNYLQCLKNGEFLEAEVKLRPEEFFTESFKNPKYFLDRYWILIKISNYNPNSGFAKCLFFRYSYGVTESELNEIKAGMSEQYNTLSTR
jgi:hypothetical protein